MLRSIEIERDEKVSSVSDPSKYFKQYENRIEDFEFLQASQKPAVRAATRLLKEKLQGESYFVHPARVALFFGENFPNPSADGVVLCLLHNILEVLDITPDQLERDFGREVRKGCELLVIDRERQKSESGYMSEYYGCLHNASDIIKSVKVFDKLDNLLFIHKQPDPGRRSRYFAEIRSHLLPLANEVSQTLGDYIRNLTDSAEKLGNELH